MIFVAIFGFLALKTIYVHNFSYVVSVELTLLKKKEKNIFLSNKSKWIEKMSYFLNRWVQVAQINRFCWCYSCLQVVWSLIKCETKNIKWYRALDVLIWTDSAINLNKITAIIFYLDILTINVPRNINICIYVQLLN